MATVSGRLDSILDGDAELGSVVIALCGYGAQVPRIHNNATLARVTTLEVNAGSDGVFTADLPGNNIIAPSGTYYTITVKDGNGDVVQTNAYVFLDGSDYVLDDIDPFDPTLPMMPITPLIMNQLQFVEWAFAMNFDGSDYTTYKTVLHGNTAPTYSNILPGNLYTFILLQDGTGGWEFNWGSTVHNGVMINHAPNGQTIQTFVADQDGSLYAISGGTYYP